MHRVRLNNKIYLVDHEHQKVYNNNGNSLRNKDKITEILRIAKVMLDNRKAITGNR